jgi:hypothetical protein
MHLSGRGLARKWGRRDRLKLFAGVVRGVPVSSGIRVPAGIVVCRNEALHNQGQQAIASHPSPVSHFLTSLRQQRLLFLSHVNIVV